VSATGSMMVRICAFQSDKVCLKKESSFATIRPSPILRAKPLFFIIKTKPAL
jgi:hypothetical protein